MRRSLAGDRVLDPRRRSPATGALQVHTAQEGGLTHGASVRDAGCRVNERAERQPAASAMISATGATAPGRTRVRSAVPPRPGDRQPGIGQGRARPQRAQRRVPDGTRWTGTSASPTGTAMPPRRPGRPSRTAFDLVAGYGGDGTQHEIANALVEASVATGRQTPMGILPGGTGNGFAREMGIPKTLREATEVLCTSTRTRAVDVGRLSDIGQAEIADRYFVQRHVRGRRARGADEPRAQGQVRRVRVPRQRHPARRRDEGRRLPRRTWTARRSSSRRRRSTSSTPG